MTEISADHTGLLKTKYSVPGSNRQLLPRPLLNQKLGEALKCRITVITAPAGYGKTTAVVKWLESISLPSVWLSIDGGDNDPVIFWRYIFSALDGVSKDIGKETEYVLASSELMKANVHISILLDRLSDTGFDFIFVLDDLHLIRNKEILDALQSFISYLPSNMHLMLISRTEPRLKLSRHSLKEDLLRLNAKELLFRPEEIEQYFKARGFFLQKDELQRIESYTEGWAAALVAVALSLKRENNIHSAINGVESCSRHIENYLVEDVMNTWTHEQWDFMEKVSILDNLCGPLCEAVTGYGDERLLRELYDENHFLIALDEEGEWFRFHHLFLNFLRKRLKKKDGAHISELHRKAGVWFRSNGLYIEAVDHFLQGACFEDALALTENIWLSMNLRGDYSNMFSWLLRLPDKYKTSAPYAMLFEANYYTSRKEFNNARERLEKVERFMETNESASITLRKDYFLAKTLLSLMEGDVESLLLSVRNAAVQDTLTRTLYADFNSYDISIYRSPICSLIKMIEKTPSKYYSALKTYRSIVTSNPGYSSLAAGEFHYETDNLNEARLQLTCAVDEAASEDCPGVLVPAMVTIAKIKRACGDTQGALEIVNECQKKIEPFCKPHWGYMLDAFTARLHLESRNAVMVEKWMEKNRLSIFQEITAAREYELIVLSRVLIRKMCYDDAYLLLGRLLKFAEKNMRTHSSVEILNLLATTAMKDLNEEAALQYIEKALLIGMREEYVRSFSDELSPMAVLLKLYIEKGQNNVKITAYARKLFQSTEKSIRYSMPSVDDDAAESRLTPAERNILLLIAKAFTNTEIASELGISLNTVKVHTRSIYKKLGVKSRMQCAKKFRETSG